MQISDKLLQDLVVYLKRRPYDEVAVLLGRMIQEASIKVPTAPVAGTNEQINIEAPQKKNNKAKKK